MPPLPRPAARPLDRAAPERVQAVLSHSGAFSTASIAWCAASSAAEGACGRGGRGQEAAIDLGPVLVARRQVDRKAPAQRVEAVGRPGEPTPRHRKRVDERTGERAAPEPRQLRIEKGEIELGVVNDQAVAGDEL